MTELGLIARQSDNSVEPLRPRTAQPARRSPQQCRRKFGASFGREDRFGRERQRLEDDPLTEQI